MISLVYLKVREIQISIVYVLVFSVWFVIIKIFKLSS